MIIAHLPVHQALLQVQGHCISYQFWHWQCFLRNLKGYLSPSSYGSQGDKEGSASSHRPYLGQGQTVKKGQDCCKSCLQADISSQFRTIPISSFLAPSLLFSLYPISLNSKPSSKLLPEILRFIKCKSVHVTLFQKKSLILIQLWQFPNFLD